MGQWDTSIADKNKFGSLAMSTCWSHLNHNYQFTMIMLCIMVNHAWCIHDVLDLDTVMVTYKIHDKWYIPEPKSSMRKFSTRERKRTWSRIRFESFDTIPPLYNSASASQWSPEDPLNVLHQKHHAMIASTVLKIQIPDHSYIMREYI